jgi:hypothetical protein
MKKEIRLIAMRATRKEVESLGIELKFRNGGDFDIYNYLFNHLDGKFSMDNLSGPSRPSYETFDKQIFLEACGMGEKYGITKDQILVIHEVTNSWGQDRLKKWFPECFEVDFKVNDWYMIKEDYLLLYKGDFKGITTKGDVWIFDKYHEDNSRKATTQEIQTALTNEALKRGFKDKVCFIPLNGKKPVTRNGNYFGYSEDDNKLLYCNYVIFEKGIWATIIPSYTIQEAEDTFKIKIK